MTMNIQEKLERFRQWQHDPRHYENRSHGSERCRNCGTEYADNYCPRCGQKAGVGRVTWKTLSQGFMLMWGLDSRSLPYTLLQLLGRPGYLIRDYISGRRQVAFPPVKMLFLVALIYILVEHLVAEPVTKMVDEDWFVQLGLDFLFWFSNNPGWGMMVSCSLLLLPTWLLFRFAPRYPKHTLPEGFYIQVFMATLMLIMLIIVIVTNITIEYVTLLAIVYYVVAYRQLFGYGWWGTSWRLLLAIFESIFLVLAFVFAYTHIVRRAVFSPNQTLEMEILKIAIFHAVNAAVLIAAYYIGKHGSKHRNRTEGNK